jgi:hypothetical protein
MIIFFPKRINTLLPERKNYHKNRGDEKMLTYYMNDSMRAYEKWAENEIINSKPKHMKPHGIKRPDTRKVVASP